MATDAVTGAAAGGGSKAKAKATAPVAIKMALAARLNSRPGKMSCLGNVEKSSIICIVTNIQK